MATKKSTPTLPQVKQCNTIGDDLFGSVAVAAGSNRWGVMTPNNGGHWATDADVASWADHAQLEAVEAPAPQEGPK